MSLIPSFMLPKNILTAIKRGNEAIQVSPRLTQAAADEPMAALLSARTLTTGLTEEEAKREGEVRVER